MKSSISGLTGLVGLFGILVFLGSPIKAAGTEVSLAWDRNLAADVAGYNVYYGTLNRTYSQTINASNANGWTALHSAAACGHTEVVRLLLSLGANTNTVDRGGDTPLTMAVKKGHGAIVALLRAAGTWG